MPIDLARTQKQFLSLDEFAETIGVSRKTLYNWITAGHLHSIKIRGSRRIPIAEARRLAHVADPVQSPAQVPASDSPSRSVKSHESTH